MEPRESVPGPISPELVLVDPDLAASARAALPDHPWPAPVRIEPAKHTRRRRVPVAATFSTLSLAALAAILGVSVLPTRDQPTFAADGQRIPSVASSTTTGVSPKAKATGRKVRRTKPESVSPKPKATGRKARRIKAERNEPRTRAAKPKQPGGRKLGAFKPAPTFAWAPRAGAAYYQVALFRSGRRFFQARTRAARLTLPAPVRFRAGKYRWIVRPAIRSRKGVRLGDPIVDATFSVGRT